jgi:hypothetical protein
VEAAFGQIQKLQVADPSIDLSNLNISTCNNPTFVAGQPNTNYLAVIAPQPLACNKQGAGPCAAGVTPNGIGPTPTSSGTAPGAVAAHGSGGSGPSGGASGASATAGPGTTGGSGQGAAAAAGTTALAAGRANTGLGVPKIDGTTLPLSKSWTWLDGLAPYAVVLLLILFALPMIVAYRRSRARPSEKGE